MNASISFRYRKGENTCDHGWHGNLYAEPSIPQAATGRTPEDRPIEPTRCVKNAYQPFMAEDQSRPVSA